jgi:hypothetical protein
MGTLQTDMYWNENNRYDDVMRADVEEAFATLTPTEQARAYSLFKLYSEVQGYGGPNTMANDMLDAIRQTIGERGNPRPPETPESILRFIEDMHR